MDRTILRYSPDPLPGASDGTPAQKAYRFHWEGPMNAIALLKQQHRLVEQLFERFEATEAEDAQKTIFFEIADNLAVHATIEERWFYPAVRARQTEEQIEEAYDEHLDVKKLILEATRAIEDPGFDGRVAALKGAVEHHVEEEEEELFPNVQKLMTAEALE